MVAWKFAAFICVLRYMPIREEQNMHSFFKEDQTIGKILLQSCIRTDHLTMKGNIENLVLF